MFECGTGRGMGSRSLKTDRKIDELPVTCRTSAGGTFPLPSGSHVTQERSLE